MRPSACAAGRTGRSSRRPPRPGSARRARAPPPSRRAARPCIPTPNPENCCGSLAARLRRRSRAEITDGPVGEVGGPGRSGRQDRRPRPSGRSRASARTARQRGDSGTRCSISAFILGRDRPRLRLDVDLVPRRATRLAASARGQHGQGEAPPQGAAARRSRRRDCDGEGVRCWIGAKLPKVAQPHLVLFPVDELCCQQHRSPTPSNAASLRRIQPCAGIPPATFDNLSVSTELHTQETTNPMCAARSLC